MQRGVLTKDQCGFLNYFVIRAEKQIKQNKTRNKNTNNYFINAVLLLTKSYIKVVGQLYWSAVLVNFFFALYRPRQS